VTRLRYTPSIFAGIERFAAGPHTTAAYAELVRLAKASPASNAALLEYFLYIHTLVLCG
jgi:hypothetical protein